MPSSLCPPSGDYVFTYYLPSKFHCHSFNAFKFPNGMWEGWVDLLPHPQLNTQLLELNEFPSLIELITSSIIRNIFRDLVVPGLFSKANLSSRYWRTSNSLFNDLCKRCSLHVTTQKKRESCGTGLQSQQISEICTQI